MHLYVGSGFHSKMKYGSGFFTMRLKLPKKDTTGLITTFYVKLSLAFTTWYFEACFFLKEKREIKEKEKGFHISTQFN